MDLDVHNKIQEKLKHGITEIRNPNKVIVPADKTRNLYKMGKEDYHKSLSEILQEHKKSNRNKVNKLNLDAKKIADQLSMSDRINWLRKNEADITAKDHKENFQNNPNFRLLNSAKINICKISKTILDKINKKLTSSIQVNQWKNSFALIEWFKNMQKKNNCSFMYSILKTFLSIYFLNFAQQCHAICKRNLLYPR